MVVALLSKGRKTVLVLGSALGTFKYFSIYLHTLAAMTWVGSVTAGAILVSLGERYRALGLELAGRLPAVTWAAVAVLLATGVFNTVYNPISIHPVTDLAGLEALRTSAYGQFLFNKHVVVTANLLLGLVWTWQLRAGRLAAMAGGGIVVPGRPQLRRLRWLGWAQVALAVVILYFAAHLEFALH